jgi:hypothetical protein
MSTLNAESLNPFDRSKTLKAFKNFTKKVVGSIVQKPGGQH